MPIYEYKCENGHVFETLQRMSDDPLTECEVCGAPVQRVFHPIAVHFKGSGFYNTDYGTKRRAREMKEGAGEGGSESKSGSGENGGSSSGSGESKKSESGAASSGAGSSSGSGSGSSGGSGSGSGSSGGPSSSSSGSKSD